MVAVLPMMDEHFDRAVAALGADVFIRAHTQRFRKDIYRVAGKPVVRLGGQEVVGALAMKVDGAIRTLVSSIPRETFTEDVPLPDDKEPLKVVRRGDTVRVKGQDVPVEGVQFACSRHGVGASRSSS